MRTSKSLTHRHGDTEKTQIGFLCASASLRQDSFTVLLRLSCRANAHKGAPPPCQGPPRQKRSRGSALLSVLWLSAALAAIAFALSTSVRGETERASTAVDGLRSYYLAVGAVQRAIVEILWTVTHPNERVIP